LVDEKDYIDEIFDSDSEKGGMIKKESEFYNEFIEFRKKKEEPEETNIISFTPLSFKEDNIEHLPVTLAAMSKHTDTSKTSESFFYYHDAKNIALKIDIKNWNQIYVSVIAETDIALEEALLYCIETKKYFLSDEDQTFYLGNYENFDSKKFNFDLIFPKDTITVLISESNHNFISKSGENHLKEVLKSETETEITFNKHLGFTVLVLKSGSYKDFNLISDDKILIPNVLLEKKMKLILY
jgi:hypothetical protein